MNFAAIRSASESARLTFLRGMNRLGATFFGAVLLLNQTYPQGIAQITGAPLPHKVVIPAAVGWFMLVEYASQRPKNPA